MVITRHGRPIARLVPEAGARTPKRALAALDRLTKSREEMEARGIRFTSAEIRATREAEWRRKK